LRTNLRSLTTCCTHTPPLRRVRNIKKFRVLWCSADVLGTTRSSSSLVSKISFDDYRLKILLFRRVSVHAASQCFPENNIIILCTIFLPRPWGWWLFSKSYRRFFYISIKIVLDVSHAHSKHFECQTYKII